MTNMIIDPFIQKQLEYYIDEIEKNEFENIYASIPVRQADLTGQLTDVLLKVRANPLEHLPYVPSNYLNGSSRTHIEIPDNVKYISDSAFFRSSLESIVIPDTVEGLGLGIFEHSPRLKSVDMSYTNCTEVTYGMGQNCASLVEFKLSSYCKNISDSAFWNCHRLEELKIDQTIDYVISQIHFSTNWMNMNHDMVVKCKDGIVLVDWYGNKQRQE